MSTEPERYLVAALERLGEIQYGKLVGRQQLVVGERLQQLIYKQAAPKLYMCIYKDIDIDIEMPRQI